MAHLYRIYDVFSWIVIEIVALLHIIKWLSHMQPLNLSHCLSPNNPCTPTGGTAKLVQNVMWPQGSTWCVRLVVCDVATRIYMMRAIGCMWCGHKDLHDACDWLYVMWLQGSTWCVWLVVSLLLLIIMLSWPYLILVHNFLTMERTLVLIYNKNKNTALLQGIPRPI